jgi:hypothetical protein
MKTRVNQNAHLRNKQGGTPSQRHPSPPVFLLLSLLFCLCTSKATKIVPEIEIVPIDDYPAVIFEQPHEDLGSLHINDAKDSVMIRGPGE